MYFSQQLGLGKVFELSGMFRGVAFAAVRDALSQGIPFMCSDWLRSDVYIPLFCTRKKNPSKTDSNPGQWAVFLKHWVPVLVASIIATIISQWFHNCQMVMQADQSLSYLETVETLWNNNGVASFFLGADARISLLLIVNIFNEVLLKRAWQGVLITDGKTD